MATRRDKKKTPLFVVCGPTACGKTTLVDRLVAELGFRRAISSTTKRRRTGETGVEYYFTDVHNFHRSKMLEYDIYGNNYYGVTMDECEKSDIVILTHSGVVKAVDYCRKQKRACYVIGMRVRLKTQLERLTQRGDTAESIYARIEDDKSRQREYGDSLYDIIIPEGTRDEVYEIARKFIMNHLDSTVV